MRGLGAAASAVGAASAVSAAATATADVRAAVPEEFDRIEKDLARVSQDKLIAETEVTTSLKRGLPPMPQTAESDRLMAMAQGIYGEIGRKLTEEGSGGAADASLSAGVGTPTLDGFGIVGGNIHTPEEYAELIQSTLLIDARIRTHSAIMDKYDPKKKVALIVDEWGGWYEVEPGTNKNFLYQQNTIRDAMIAGVTLNIFNNHSDRVRMANLAQTVNVLQAVILKNK